MIAYTYEKERENWCVTKRTANVIPSLTGNFMNHSVIDFKFKQQDLNHK